MNRFKRLTIKEIAVEIDRIIANTHNGVDYKYMFNYLENKLETDITHDEIVLLCETTLKIAKTKNRILRHLEKDVWRFIDMLPMQLSLDQEFSSEDPENEYLEELLPNTDYSDLRKQILSRLIGLVQEILALKDDNSNGSNVRRAGSLSLLRQLIDEYEIPFAKDMFLHSISSKNKKEQYEALQGLGNYYAIYEDDPDEELIKTLTDIHKETDDDTIASTCLQIQINCGKMDQMKAVFKMGDWKDAHYYRRK